MVYLLAPIKLPVFGDPENGLIISGITPVALVLMPTSDVTPEMRKARIDYFVRAVNSHDELVEVLKESQRVISRDSLDNTAKTCLRKGMAILARAEAEEVKA